MAHLHNTDSTRRRFLATGGAALLALWLGRPSDGDTPSLHSHVHAQTDAELMAAAIALIDHRFVRQGRITVHGPVSTLQREFCLGYRRACALAEQLEAQGIWHVERSETGASAVLNARRVQAAAGNMAT